MYLSPARICAAGVVMGHAAPTCCAAMGVTCRGPVALLLGFTAVS
ncbi:hypothetical protein ACFQDE_16175 [Deinococcus caeni]